MIYLFQYMFSHSVQYLILKQTSIFLAELYFVTIKVWCSPECIKIVQCTMYNVRWTNNALQTMLQIWKKALQVNSQRLSEAYRHL